MISLWNDQSGTCADGALGIARNPLGREKSATPPPPCLPDLSSSDFLWLWPNDSRLCSSFLTWEICPPSSCPASSLSFPRPPPPPSLANPPTPPLLPSPEAPPNPKTPPKVPLFGPSSSTSSLIAKQSGWSGSLKNRQSLIFRNMDQLHLCGRGPWGNELIVLKAFAARRERWDLRWSLRLPLAVYIFPQKSHLPNIS